MRFYARTSRNTGVSVGPVGVLVIVVLVIGLPVYVVDVIFSTWWSATIAGVVMTLLALGWESQREQRLVAARAAAERRHER